MRLESGVAYRVRMQGKLDGGREACVCRAEMTGGSARCRRATPAGVRQRGRRVHNREGDDRRVRSAFGWRGAGQPTYDNDAKLELGAREDERSKTGPVAVVARFPSRGRETGSAP